MISVIICTHNRADILPYCLTSLAQQTVGSDRFEVIVVDNASVDGTCAVTTSFQRTVPYIKYVYEPVVGLSQARNRGYREAKTEWVIYIDDDAKAHANLMERALWVIDNFDFDCFGGRFFPWYLAPKPKWLSGDFGLFPKLLAQIGELPSSQHAAGGVIAFKKAALADVGGFPVELGMRGNDVGYGEENWVQDEMRKRNYRIGFDPELKIDHLVGPYKYTLRWQLRRMIAKGRTERLMAKGEKSLRSNAVLFSKAILFTLYSLIKNSFRFLGRKDYYLENYMLDSTGYFFKVLGYLAQS